MLIQLFILFLFIVLLFFFTQKISSHIFSLVSMLTGSKKLSIWIVHILFLPGTIIHELSHLFTAKILKVQTGKLTVWPRVEEGNKIKVGTLEVGKSDPIRLAVIGLAPLFVGLALIYLTGVSFFPNFSLHPKHYTLYPRILLGFYFIFSISATMFSSKKDLKPLLFVIPILILIFASLFLAGVRLIFTQKFIELLNLLIRNLNRYLLLAVILNGFVYAVLIIGTKSIKRIRKYL